jgi:glycosyltransferase involved in cell wall biosynthesis
MEEFDYTVVIPCLNEEVTLAEVLIEAKSAANESQFKVELIVVDNGSSDGSVEIARNHGALVVNAPIRGYGAALDAGIRAARSNLILMGDADCSYSFKEGLEMIKTLSHLDVDIVMGNRFTGKIESGAMPWHHKYLGNPVLSFLGRKFFRIPIGDFHCGMRAFRKDVYLEASPTTTGMEFATEMIAKFANLNSKFAEVPITLRKDKRNRKPHLRSFPDGWRHLKMMLLFSPQFFQLYPGFLATFIGLAGIFQYATIGRINLLFAEGKVQTALFSLLIFSIGINLVAASLISMAHIESKNIPRFRFWNILRSLIKSKYTPLASSSFALMGVIGLMYIGGDWIGTNTPSVDPITESRKTIPLIALTLLGVHGSIATMQVRQILSRFW